MAEARHRLLYDIRLRRPACALLQAAVGGDWGLTLHLWPSRSWLTHPTDGMMVLAGTPEQFEHLATLDLAREAVPDA